MSYRFQVQPSGITLVVFRGQISQEEERQALRDFAAHPGVDLGADILVDRSRSTVTVGPADVRPILNLASEVFRERESRPRLAIVAPTDLEFGMARMMELTGGDQMPHRVMVLRNLADACEWLGVEEAGLVWPPSDEAPDRRAADAS